MHISRLLVDREGSDELSLTSCHNGLNMLLENLSSANDFGLVLLPVLEVACEEICKLLAL